MTSLRSYVNKWKNNKSRKARFKQLIAETEKSKAMQMFNKR